MSVCPSVCPSVCLSLKISVTTEPIGFYSLGNIPTGPVVIFGYFLGGVGHPQPPQKMKNTPPKKKKFLFKTKIKIVGSTTLPPKFFLNFSFKSKICKIGLIKPLGAKPLEARGEAAIIIYF